jgi:hypothetical protein
MYCFSYDEKTELAIFSKHFADLDEKGKGKILNSVAEMMQPEIEFLGDYQLTLHNLQQYDKAAKITASVSFHYSNGAWIHCSFYSSDFFNENFSDRLEDYGQFGKGFFLQMREWFQKIGVTKDEIFRIDVSTKQAYNQTATEIDYSYEHELSKSKRDEMENIILREIKALFKDLKADYESQTSAESLEEYINENLYIYQIDGLHHL